MKVKDLRESFIRFFMERDHRIISSSSLIPKDDPTLLFTTAGMVQFKPMFAGTVPLEYTRAASIQKCLRTSDLENVGKTKRHCTFFEMLGNFSFGDYFKKEAIEYAWDYSTGVIGFPEEYIWISIFENDDESFKLWNKHIGVPGDKIIRLGKEDNFWGPAGDSGACGPCSELYLDRGESFGCGSKDCKPGCDCERFLEYWNLVFNQFYQDESGSQTPLPQTGIDTGMGLERLATLVQNVDSIYETDELKKLVDFVCRETGVVYEKDKIAPVNVLVEHARALSFAIADGGYPSNEGRGYVLRRILRRALRFGRPIGISEPFLYKITDQIIETLSGFYPELEASKQNITNLLEGEEKRFLETLENGMDRLEEVISLLKKKSETTISGKDAFVLYDTFGFPLEMTIEIAGENSLKVDTSAFEEEMEKQRSRGKQSWKSGDAGMEKIFEAISMEVERSQFRGYDNNSIETEIAWIGKDGKPVDLGKGDSGIIVARESTFYGESGGQVGDKGYIITDDSSQFEVHDTKKFNDVIFHLGTVTKGRFSTGQKVSTQINVVRRNLTRANHTATHLLQASLRKVLGDHVRQTGSLVDPEHLRFDFSHFNSLSDEEISRIENQVNDVIWEAIPVDTMVLPLQEALDKGAMAVFDEKYEDTVRVIQVDDVSMELCGGTHVDNTAKIGVFKIVKESSPGAGMRRIEAITLKSVLEKFRFQDKLVSEISEELNASEGALSKKVHDLILRNKALEKELEKSRTRDLASNVDEYLNNALDINGIKVVMKQFNGMDMESLKKLSDEIRSREKNSLVMFGSAVDDKAMLVCSSTASVTAMGIDCSKIIKEISSSIDGRGGGKKDMAQAGGKNKDGLEKALNDTPVVIRDMLS